MFSNRSKAFSGETLADQMIQRFCQEIDPDYDKHEEESEERILPYAPYADDPENFFREELNVHVTGQMSKILQSVRDNPVTKAKSANGVGKTFTAARIAGWFYLSHRGAQVYTAAAPPERNLKQLLWGEIREMVRDHPEMFSGDKKRAMSIERSPREFIQGVTIPQNGKPEDREAMFSGKHAPYLLFILDEADAIPPEVFRGIESCMSGGHVRLLMLLNPRAERGTAYQMEKEGEANVVQLSAFDHPNVRTGEDIIPGAVDRQVTVKRIHKWSRPLQEDEPKDDECFKVPDFLDGAVAQKDNGETYPPLEAGWRKITENSMHYMVLAQYPSQGEFQLISSEWIDRAVARWHNWVAEHGERPPKRVKPIMGLDVSESEQGDLNTVALRYHGFVSRIKKHKGMEPPDVARWGAKIYHSNNVRRCYVDATGIGAGVAPGMRSKKAFSTFGVKVSNKPTRVSELGEFYTLRDELYWQLRDWLKNDPSATLPPDEDLIEELKAPTYEVNERNGITIMGKDDMREVLGRSPDSLDALVLTFAPTQKRKPNKKSSRRSVVQSDMGYGR